MKKFILLMYQEINLSKKKNNCYNIFKKINSNNI